MSAENNGVTEVEDEKLTISKSHSWHIKREIDPIALIAVFISLLTAMTAVSLWFYEYHKSNEFKIYSIDNIAIHFNASDRNYSPVWEVEGIVLPIKIANLGDEGRFDTLEKVEVVIENLGMVYLWDDLIIKNATKTDEESTEVRPIKIEAGEAITGDYFFTIQSMLEKGQRKLNLFNLLREFSKQKDNNLTLRVRAYFLQEKMIEQQCIINHDLFRKTLDVLRDNPSESTKFKMGSYPMACIAT